MKRFSLKSKVYFSLSYLFLFTKLLFNELKIKFYSSKNVLKYVYEEDLHLFLNVELFDNITCEEFINDFTTRRDLWLKLA